MPDDATKKGLGTDGAKAHLANVLAVIGTATPKRHKKVTDGAGRIVRSFSWPDSGLAAVVATDPDDRMVVLTLLSSEIDPDDSDALREIVPELKIKPIKVRDALPPPPARITVDNGTALDQLPVKVKFNRGWLSGFLFSPADHTWPRNVVHIVATVAAGSLDDQKVKEKLNAITERDCDKMPFNLEIVGPATFKWNTATVSDPIEVMTTLMAGGAVECPDLQIGRSNPSAANIGQTPNDPTLLSDFYFAWDPNPDCGGDDFVGGGLFGIALKETWDRDHSWDDRDPACALIPDDAPISQEMECQWSVVPGVAVLDARQWLLDNGATENIDILNWESYQDGSKPKWDSAKLQKMLDKMTADQKVTAAAAAVKVAATVIPAAAAGPLSNFYFARDLDIDVFSGNEDADRIVVVQKEHWDATRTWGGPGPTDAEIGGIPVLPFCKFVWNWAPGLEWADVKTLFEDAGAVYNTALRSGCHEPDESDQLSDTETEA